MPPNWCGGLCCKPEGLFFISLSKGWSPDLLTPSPWALVGPRLTDHLTCPWQAPNRSEEEVLRLAYSLWRNGFVCTVPAANDGGKKKAKEQSKGEGATKGAKEQKGEGDAKGPKKSQTPAAPPAAKKEGSAKPVTGAGSKKGEAVEGAKAKAAPQKVKATEPDAELLQGKQKKARKQ